MRFVGLFFVVKGNLLLHKTELDQAEKYGDFLNFSESHMDIWDKYYYKKYRVDFDYFPRGRIVYNTKTDTFYIYYDKCIKDNIDDIKEMLKENKIKCLTDFHYKCHNCNKNYVL